MASEHEHSVDWLGQWIEVYCVNVSYTTKQLVLMGGMCMGGRECDPWQS